MTNSIAADHKERLKVAKANVDAETGLADDLGIFSIPTIAFFDPG